ncbi:MAG: tyrosine--tRNA ligase, partial [Patescibacteria group bacterium]|nr:tyrosine--tRNA ligase [Patescibacteria group bacterium]
IFIIFFMDKKTKEQKIKELLNRGTVDLIVKKDLEEKLKSGKKLRIKYGIDPTGPKIHLGRASTMQKLAKFQELGHKIVLIVGDFTAQIGDSSDKTKERPMLTYKEIKKNMENYLPQIGRIFDVKKAEVHYNSEWLGKLNYFDICNQADNFSIAQILDRDNFSKRYKEGVRISLREMLYPLMQGYDSVAIKSDIEIGGSDQLFNILAGRVLQKAYNQKPQDIITFKLMDGTDGRKMSTSWGNIICITDQPNDIYGKIMSIKDELIIQYFELATDIPTREIKKMNDNLKNEKINPRDLKMNLGCEIVSMYYSKKEAEKAEQHFKNIFQKHQTPDKIKIFKVKIKKINIIDLLIKSKLCVSKSDARRMILQGGVKIDNKKITDSNKIIEINKEGKILQKGKRNFIKIIF